LYILHAEIVWISTEWAGINITLFGDDEAYKNLGKESCLITLSHRGDLDWVAGYIMGVRFRFLHVSSERRCIKIN
jgi:lysophosphatidic acid acyltransferase/lysophosphatidylinositol acyltransferase